MAIDTKLDRTGVIAQRSRGRVRVLPPPDAGNAGTRQERGQLLGTYGGQAVDPGATAGATVALVAPINITAILVTV